MSNKPTHTAFVVTDASGDKKAQWFEIATVWSHTDGKGFDVLIPPGVTVTGRIVIRARKAAEATEK